MATSDTYYINAADKMADFLWGIQARSEKQRYLDGCWIRRFDYELWDYYGSLHFSLAKYCAMQFFPQPFLINQKHFSVLLQKM